MVMKVRYYFKNAFIILCSLHFVQLVFNKYPMNISIYHAVMTLFDPKLSFLVGVGESEREPKLENRMDVPTIRTSNAITFSLFKQL